LEIRNNSQKGIAVPDANVVPVTSTSDVIDLMNLGQKNRAVCSTAMNDRSSRSHRFVCCFCISASSSRHDVEHCVFSWRL